jgi:hypothetical protein
MAKSNQPKSAKPEAKAEEAAPAKQETKPAAAAAAKPIAAAKPPAAPKAPAPKAKKTDKPTTLGVKPVIDTTLVAQNAANLLANRSMLQGRAGGDKPNSAGFRQMKEGLSKPSAPSIAFLNDSGSQKKSNQPFGNQKQVGHNQTFGADVNRAGVPRRTGGG